MQLHLIQDDQELPLSALIDSARAAEQSGGRRSASEATPPARSTVWQS
jgi:hypothetical protein